MKSMGTETALLPTNILQNIFFCDPQKKESHTCLERREGEQIMTGFAIFFVDYPFKCFFFLSRSLLKASEYI